MKFSIGDKVLLRRTGEEGRVVAFLSKTMMAVDVDGVHFPVYNDEVDHPYLKWFTEGAKKAARGKAPMPDIPTEKIAARPQRLARGIYLSFIPQFAPGIADDIIESFRIHLINETPDDIRFTYDARTAAGAPILAHRGALHAFGNLYLHPLLLEELNAQPRLNWDVSTGSDRAKNELTGTVRIRGSQLARHIQRLLEDNEPAFSVLLTQDAEGTPPVRTLPSADAALPILKSLSNKGSTIVTHTAARPVIDLHINEILKDIRGISPEEMLQAQLAFFERQLHAAITGRLPRMIVIHGVGNGTLRSRVHEVLNTTAAVCRYEHRWMDAYGWGATEIMFEAG